MAGTLDDDPLWYKDAIIYELHVRAFHDSDGDGIGDFPGLTEKLDYLESLGITALWLLPFYPSPLKDDGYDIADYRAIHPSYGTMEDFQRFLDEAHRRGIRVITELVINHTSDQHHWFREARRAPPGSPKRNFYVWSDTADKYKGARIIFKDFETSNWTWDPFAKQYFWHRFYHHQPDLNFDNPDVRRAVMDVMDYWLKMGVDGLRLDAIPYLFEREGTSCENLVETHGVLRELRAHVDRHFQSRMLLAEANQWPEDAIAYFGQGDECHMSFHFPLMPRLFMATRMEDSYPILDILRQTPAIPDNCQWATFLRNHDELTLEMVTDEERDYMYRVYATDPQMRINLGIRRRLAPLLGNHRGQIELMNALLFSMPGAPVMYYGDEIGMGDNIYLADRNGVRTPMQWSADRNAGFSRANPQKLYLPVIIDPEYHYEALNVEAQNNNSHSLLWWTRRLIALRKRFKAFSRGTLEFLHPENRKVLAFVRRWQDETVLVVANLSRFPQSTELDLSEFKGRMPTEVFGLSNFRQVGEAPYPITLGPYGFYWFSLEAGHRESLVPGAPLPTLEVRGDWTGVLADDVRPSLLRVLPHYVRHRRWFGAKARTIRTLDFADVIRLDEPRVALLLITIEYVQGDPETYLLPVGFAAGEAKDALLQATPHAVIAHLRTHQADGVLFDAMFDKTFGRYVLEALSSGRRFRGERGEVVASPAATFSGRALGPEVPDAQISRGEQSNTSLLYGSQFIFKLYRRVEAGVHPEVEFGRVLASRFANAPELLGSFEYKRRGREPETLGVLQRFVQNQGNAWDFTIDAISQFYDRALARPEAPAEVPSVFSLLDVEVPQEATELVGSYLEHVRLLGQRTGELHLALADCPDDPAFATEPFTDFYRRALYHGLVGVADRAMLLLRRKLHDFGERDRPDAEAVLAREKELRERFSPIRDRPFQALRIRCHGDYHLSQVLWTGKDWVIIDFEGEPARAMSERRIKRSPLRDVAGMLRSFHYASYAARFDAVPGVVTSPPKLGTWGRYWQAWVSRAFLKAYFDTTAAASLFPRDKDDLRLLLNAYLIEKAAYEVAYELNNRPAWVRIPLQGMLQLLDDFA